MTGTDRKSLDQRLKNAYAVKSAADVVELYGSWADDYDTELLDELGYVAPRVAAEAFCRHVQDKNALVLDVGCGTGLVGAELHQAGYQHVDGLDISNEMLERAREKGAYEALLRADLTQTLDLPDNHYAAMISAGTFTHGHVGPDGLDELIRTTKPGGIICFTINEGVFEKHDFPGKFQTLVTAGKVRVVEQVRKDYILNENIGCIIVTLSVL